MKNQCEEDNLLTYKWVWIKTLTQQYLIIYKNNLWQNIPYNLYNYMKEIKSVSIFNGKDKF